jgi:hypothetical protein
MSFKQQNVFSYKEKNCRFGIRNIDLQKKSVKIPVSGTLKFRLFDRAFNIWSEVSYICNY